LPFVLSSCPVFNTAATVVQTAGGCWLSCCPVLNTAAPVVQTAGGCWCICELMYRDPSRDPCIGTIYSTLLGFGGIQAIILSYMVSLATRRRRGRGGGAWGTPDPTPAPTPAPGPGGTLWPSFSAPWPGRIPMWPFQGQGGPRPQPQPAAMLAAAAPLFAPLWIPPAPPSQQPTWPGGWDQAVLAQSFSAMGWTPPVSTEWIADSGASFHTTPDAGILSSVRPPHLSCPSSIMVGDGSCLHVTAVGFAPGSFRLPNVSVAPQMVHNLLSIRQFTADNSCSIEFDSSGLTVKDSASRRPLLWCDSTGPLYTLRLPSSAAPLSPSSSPWPS